MLRARVDWFWHDRLQQPYRLHIGVDEFHGREGLVVLLHGIGAAASVWGPVVQELEVVPCQVLAPDLLGFGASPKPGWPQYTVDDHAKAVIAAITRHRRVHKSAILVGHSMGCLVAVRVAKLRPDLVEHLVLYQPPLYVGLPEKRRYSLRKDLYYRLYKYMLAQPLAVSPSKIRQALIKRTGIGITPETLQPFLKSLRNTIMEQTTLADMRHLRAPIDVVYGSLDMVVIRGKSKTIFREIAAPLQTHTIAELHGISKRAGKFLAMRIQSALGGKS